MSDHGWDSGDMFPHDGEFGDMCTGFGCDCDERHYGSRGGGGGCQRPSAGCAVVITIILIILSVAIPGVGALVLLGELLLLYIMFIDGWTR